MANREACELYIEQEIKDALSQGKKPWTIGKELAGWVEKLFETSISPNTLTRRAQRIEAKSACTNVQEKSNKVMISEHTTTEPEQQRVPVSNHGSVTHPTSNRGGVREGAGRPTKQRGSFDDWRKLCELEHVVTAAIAEMGTLTVDAQHRIPARSKCEALAEKFKKLAQKLVG